MYSGYGGSPSRALSTMSLSVRPVRPLASRSITRSQSFTGVNTYDKPYRKGRGHNRGHHNENETHKHKGSKEKHKRNLTVFSTPGLSRKPSRASRLFTMSTKTNPPPKVPQPERLDQVYEALKTGLQSYLQVHQTDLDTLSRQIKESKRNSRLGFLYELDKQMKVTERYIRKLEFHLSKIEEFYEAYCMQRRLRDGADKMVKAYTVSSASKEARESLAEAGKGYKEYTENMCVLESEFENQLGKFHIKMKGLAGFARLCAGDQYEIFMKYGRQRWKLRGRIEINAKQVWDSEEIVFQPLINEFLSVKVTELKSLANHVVVGSVSCETKDLFAALPQMVAVDINDLGTIKLSLEVTWNPFDKDDQGSVAGTVNKPPSISKRVSAIFDQTPPDTPPLRSLPRNLTRRQHWPLLDIFRGTLSQSCSCSDNSPTRQPTASLIHLHQELENGPAWSNSSESSDDSTSPQLNAHQKAVVVKPDIQPVGPGSSFPQPDISFCPRDSPSSTQNAIHQSSNLPKQQTESNRDEEKGTGSAVPDSDEEVAGKKSPVAAVDVPISSINNSHSYLRSLSHISENSADGIGVADPAGCESGEVMSLASGISINDIEMVVACRTPEPLNSAATDTADFTDQQDTISKAVTSSTHGTEEDDPDTLSQMSNMLPDSEDVTYVAQRVSVEEDGLCAGPSRLSREGDALVDSGLEDALGAVVSSIDDYRGQFPELQLLEQELKLLQVTLKGGRHSRSSSMVSLTVETALGSFDFLNGSDWEEEEEEGDKRNKNGRSLLDRSWENASSPASPLTTGCATLDSCLVVHLKNCNTQLLRLGMFGPLRCGEMYALDRLLREARVLEIIRRLVKENPRPIRQPAEVIPELDLCLGAVSLWQDCVGQGSVYSVPAERFLNALSASYSSLLPERADTVFLCLAERVLDQRLPRRGSSRDGVMVTLFQLWSYLESNGISDMDTHIIELSKEVWLVQSLESCDQDVIVHTLRRPAECSLRREGVHAVAKLLKDPRGKVSASASSVLRSLAAQPKQRKQALVSCLELLEDENVDNRVCGCKALACLKAKESIDQLVYLCRTDKEEVRDAAKQTLLVLGEEGKMAHRHVESSQDSISRLFAPGSMASTAF